MISQSNHQYPSRKYHCPTCRGRRTVWHPEIRNCACSACKGKGYLVDEDMTPADYENAANVRPLHEEGRSIHLTDIVQSNTVKRRGRPPSKR